PLDYESSALPLSYAGEWSCLQTASTCPGADSNRDALRHHPLKMACLPISPPGPCVLASLTIQQSYNPTSYQLSALENGIPTASFRSMRLSLDNCPTRERRGSNPRPLE